MSERNRTLIWTSALALILCAAMMGLSVAAAFAEERNNLHITAPAKAVETRRYI